MTARDQHCSTSRTQETYCVAARVALQLGGQSNGRTEEENAVQHVDHDHDDRVQCPVNVEAGRQQIEHGKQGESRREHRVVDGGGVAREGFGDHVADKGHDEERPQELDEISECATSSRSRYIPPRPAGPTEHPSNP